MTCVVRLGDTAGMTIQQLGNKAANLSFLKMRGFPIPDGYCLSPDFNGCTAEEWQEKLVAALKGLPSPWAVRSSSNAEDSASLAFPGIFYTALGVRTTADAFIAIEKVKESARSPLFLEYARANHYSADLHMAVLVQSMVRAVASGVAFSQHPVSGADVVTIDATLGLGEPLVSGMITPDNFEVDHNGMVTRVRIGSKKRKLILIEGALKTVETQLAERTSPSISDANLVKLAKLVRQIADLFGKPQDVEWALDQQGEIAILQARPITAISQLPRGQSSCLPTTQSRSRQKA